MKRIIFKIKVSYLKPEDIYLAEIDDKVTKTSFNEPRLNKLLKRIGNKDW